MMPQRSGLDSWQEDYLTVHDRLGIVHDQVQS